MKWEQYISLFDDILNGKLSSAPYDNEGYVEIVRLNQSRMNRWMKKGELSQDTLSVISSVRSPQRWILITEPWCADAANIAPFIYKISEISPFIELVIQLRDTDSEIDAYLTNGAKAMPKLIVRDASGNDLFTWGPRPEECTTLVRQLKIKNTPADHIKRETQQWYNNNKGQGFQKEITGLVTIHEGILS